MNSRAYDPCSEPTTPFVSRARAVSVGPGLTEAEKETRSFKAYSTLLEGPFSFTSCSFSVKLNDVRFPQADPWQAADEGEAPGAGGEEALIVRASIPRIAEGDDHARAACPAVAAIRARTAAVSITRRIGWFMAAPFSDGIADPARGRMPLGRRDTRPTPEPLAAVTVRICPVGVACHEADPPATPGVRHDRDRLF